MTCINSSIVSANTFRQKITNKIRSKSVKSRTAGIIGGLAPQSTGLFYQTITNYCLHRQLPNFPRMLINSVNPWQVTDMLARNDMEGLLFFLQEEIERIGDQVDFVAMVCNSIHAVIQPLRQRVSIPVLAIYEEVCREVAVLRPKKVGILGTKTTVDHCFYQKELSNYGIASAVLSPTKETAFDHHIFEEMLHGRQLGTMKKMILDAIDELKNRGCEAIVLACTELPLFVSQKDTDIPLFSSTGILAEAVVVQCFVH